MAEYVLLMTDGWMVGEMPLGATYRPSAEELALDFLEGYDHSYTHAIVVKRDHWSVRCHTVDETVDYIMERERGWLHF